MRAVAAGQRLEIDRVLAAFAGIRLGADAIHRDAERAVRLGAERAQGHARRVEALADLGDRLDLLDRHRRLGRLEVEQIAQGDRGQLADTLNALLLHGMMSASVRNSVMTAATAIPTSTSQYQLKRAQTAVYLVVTSAQYQVER